MQLSALPIGGTFIMVSALFSLSTQAHSLSSIPTEADTTAAASPGPDDHHFKEVQVVSSHVGRIRRSPYNTVAIDTRAMTNTTKSIADALGAAPGVKLRETGGMGSDLAISLDGFGGRHVKVFIDGVPQEGVGRSFGLNNIPVAYAERIEVYKGVVPVGFGTDALGGVINIVTSKKRRAWYGNLDYSYGSFNTHRTNVQWGQSLGNGFFYNLHFFQNYSNNDYKVDVPIEDFSTGRIDRTKKERVRRFHDTYHNEALIAKWGWRGLPWADQLTFSLALSNMGKDVQNGVRQEIVYGARRRTSQALMPSMSYQKYNLFTQGLDFNLTANYNRTFESTIDTSAVRFNWRGETLLMNSPGEQSYTHLESTNHNANAIATLKYRIGTSQLLTLNHVANHFVRDNTSLLAKVRQQDAINKTTTKHISGLSYAFTPSDRWSLSAFVKHYGQHVAGPIAANAAGDLFERRTSTIDAWGYGAAAATYLLPHLQAKLSYEKAYRLPTIDEQFGDEDLETGQLSLRPEQSHNLNANLSYHFRPAPRHNFYVETGILLRDTRDYIQRSIVGLGGGRSGATYVNYGRVHTLGANLSLRYDLGRRWQFAANFTEMDIRDNQPTAIGTSMPNFGYKHRMPNVPYRFGDFSATYHWHNALRKGNKLSVTYDNQYLHTFSYYNAQYGTNAAEWAVPTQFSHNLALTYSLARGRYHFSLECRNLTDERLYDNFSLQKAGRAFYAKVRIQLGNK